MQNYLVDPEKINSRRALLLHRSNKDGGITWQNYSEQ